MEERVAVIRVMIVDDHRLIREGLRAILKIKEGIEVVGEADDGAAAVALARQVRPDVVLMDISMPRMNGVEATRLIKRDCPEVGIICLTIHEEEAYVVDSLKAGATGYLLKDADSTEIVKAIRTVARGESLVDSSMAGKLLTHLSQATGRRPALARQLRDLTGRELTVLQHIAEGKTNKEIAVALRLSEKTVKNHVRNIFHKLGVGDRTQAVTRALRQGLLKIDAPIPP